MSGAASIFADTSCGMSSDLRQVAIGALYSAPVKDPKRVLDLGTGTGIWALEFGTSLWLS